MVAILFASTLYVEAIGFDAEKAYESIFVIYSGESLGSGFAIGENCIVTNAHVIQNSHSITVETYGGAKHKASVLGMDEKLDVAVLVVEDARFTYLEVADLSSMKTGDDIYAIGAPNGMAYTLTKGSVSAKERMVRNQIYIQIDAPINQGNSGGPLMSDAGQVLGMNTLKISNSEGIGLAIPISRVCEYLKHLGIELDAKGNVVNSVDNSGEITSSNTEPNENNKNNENDENADSYDEKKATNIIASIAVVVAVLSLAVNVVLVVLLLHEKKKNIVVPYDPRERTDFEIDILE